MDLLRRLTKLSFLIFSFFSHVDRTRANIQNYDGTVGRLMAIKENKGRFSCTFFLVGANEIATSSVCVPRDIVLEGASCKGRIKFKISSLKSESPNAQSCKAYVAQNPAVSGHIRTPPSIFKGGWTSLKTEEIPQGKVLEIASPQSISELPSIFETTVLTVGAKGAILPVTCQAKVTTHASVRYAVLRNCGNVVEEGAPLLSKDSKVLGLVVRIFNAKLKAKFGDAAAILTVPPRARL